MIGGLIYNKALAWHTAASDFCFKAQQPFAHTKGVKRDRVDLRVHHYRLSLAALSITLLIRRLRRL